MATTLRRTDPVIDAIAAATNDLKAEYDAQFRAILADLTALATLANGTKAIVNAGTGTVAAADVTVGTASQGFHRDASEVTIHSADGDGTLATALTLCYELQQVVSFHLKDTLAHKVTDAAHALTAASPTSLATAITAANDMKAQYNLHRASTSYHYKADSTNTVTATNATDQASLDTLITSLKAQINAHMASGAAAKSLRVVSA